MAQASATGEEGFSLALDSLESLHWLGIGLAAISGVIHLYLGVQFIGDGLGVPFLFAGVVFLVGIAAIVVDYRRRTFYALGVPFTLGQIVLWYVINADDINAGDIGTLGIVDKVAQVLLVAVLVVLYRRSG
jgi:nicotinamide riboside transporter PnuC